MSATELYWQQWDDEYLLYHSASGDTHLMDSIGASVVQALQCSPQSLADLQETLGDDGVNTELPHSLSVYIETLLAKLHRLGVIEPA